MTRGVPKYTYPLFVLFYENYRYTYKMSITMVTDKEEHVLSKRREQEQFSKRNIVGQNSEGASIRNNLNSAQIFFV